MCGLAGAVGDYDPQIVKSLLILNYDRGSDAAGLYNNTLAMAKKAVSSRAWLRTPEPHAFIEESRATGSIYGHTRAGTRGGNSDNNAHPFRYGDIVGAHNGVITNAPSTYAVDSMWAFDELSKVEPGEYQKALGKMQGWYMLVWRDGRDGLTYFLSWNGDLSITKVGNAFYYSSLDQHLHTATGAEPTAKFASGDVMTWDGKKFKKIATKFTGHTHQQQQNNNYNRSHNYNSSSTNRWDDSYTGEVMRLGPNGVWVGRRKNDVWDMLTPFYQDNMSNLFKGAALGNIYRITNPEVLSGKADKKKEEKASLTEEEMEKQRQQIQRDGEFSGQSPAQIEKALEQAGLA